MLKIIFGCIILFLCLPTFAGDTINYDSMPVRVKRRISYTMQPSMSYEMQPKVVKTQPKVEDKKEVKTGYVCDENGCRPVNSTYYRYRIFRRR